MSQKMRTIGIGFFQANMIREAEVGVGDFLRQVAEERNGYGPVIEKGNYFFEAREVERLGQNFIRGVFAKFRQDQIPHAGQAGGPERDLDLADEEGLIEKNHFVFRPSENLLIYQVNGHGSTQGQFARYITENTGETVDFNPLIQADAYERLMKDEATPICLEMTLARPRNPEIFPDDEWSQGLLSMVNQVGGATIGFRVRAQQNSPYEERKNLTGLAKRVAANFADTEVARKVKVEVNEEGNQHPIDLVADRITSKQDVEMDGKYPKPESVYAALWNALDEQSEAITAVIGEEGNRLN